MSMSMLYENMTVCMHKQSERKLKALAAIIVQSVTFLA